MTAREDLVKGLDRVIPDGPKGDRLKAYLLKLADEYADERVAREAERIARPSLAALERTWDAARGKWRPGKVEREA